MSQPTRTERMLARAKAGPYASTRRTDAMNERPINDAPASTAEVTEVKPTSKNP